MPLNKQTLKKNIMQQGIGMIEMLVALVLLGVGLLGALSLQANGLQSNQRANFVTEAHFLAQEMADKILAYGSVYTIRVMWDRDRTGAVGTNCSSNDKNTHLTCFEMQVRL